MYYIYFFFWIILYKNILSYFIFTVYIIVWHYAFSKALCKHGFKKHFINKALLLLNLIHAYIFKLCVSKRCIAADFKSMTANSCTFWSPLYAHIKYGKEQCEHSVISSFVFYRRK